MENYEKFITIKTMAELLAYEIYYIYNIDKDEINNIEYVYNVLASHLIFDKYKEEIMHLGISMAINLYEIPIKVS